MGATTVQTTAENVGKDRVKLRVEVAEDALGPAIAAAYKRWASEIKLPGFRKGKIPRPLIDAHVGPEVVRDEALRDALPDLYRQALEAEDLVAIAPPDIEILSFQAGTPLVFEATVDVRPEVDLPALDSITVEAPPPDVTDAELDEQLEQLRDRFAELDTIGREARRGDYVLIDLKGYVHDQPVEGATAPDLLYELGSHGGPPGLDDHIEGNRPGAILKFNATMPDDGSDLAGQEISFTVLLKEVKTKRLPTLDDDFAKTVGEFDTLDDLKADLRGRLTEVKAGMVEDEIRARALRAVVDRAAFEPPDKLVDGEVEHRLAHIDEDLKRAGLTLDEYARRSGFTELEIRRDVRTDAARSIKAELILEEIARREEFDITQEDLGREVALLAARAGRDPKEVAREVANERALRALTADIMRRKALDHIVRSVDVTGRAKPSEAEAQAEADPT